MSAIGFLNGLSDDEFEDKFLELARSESFSAIASGAGTPDDTLNVRNAMIAKKLPIGLYQDDQTICVIVNMIADRFMKKL